MTISRTEFSRRILPDGRVEYKLVRVEVSGRNSIGEYQLTDVPADRHWIKFALATSAGVAYTVERVDIAKQLQSIAADLGLFDKEEDPPTPRPNLKVVKS